MMRRILVILVLIPLTTLAASDGQVSLKSSHSVTVTIDRLETLLKQKGMTIVARIDHAAAAEKVGLVLRSTQLLVFGNPKVGTPLMQCAQSVAIDLPQKMLAWEDEQGQVWLSYNDPGYLARRHGVSGCEAPLQKVSKALANFAENAVAR